MIVKLDFHTTSLGLQAAELNMGVTTRRCCTIVQYSVGSGPSKYSASTTSTLSMMDRGWARSFRWLDINYAWSPLAGHKGFATRMGFYSKKG